MAFDLLPIDASRIRPPHPRRLEAMTFVVQRRVNIPLTSVQRGLADRTRLVEDRMLDLGTGVVAIDEALRPVAPFSAQQPVPTWSGRAQLLSPRGRRVATVEVDVSMWSSGSTCIALRPVARFPDRWSARRLRRYFALAHAAVDAIGVLLVRRAIDAADRDAFVIERSVVAVR